MLGRLVSTLPRRKCRSGGITAKGVGVEIISGLRSYDTEIGVSSSEIAYTSGRTWLPDKIFEGAFSGLVRLRLLGLIFGATR